MSIEALNNFFEYRNYESLSHIYNEHDEVVPRVALRFLNDYEQRDRRTAIEFLVDTICRTTRNNHTLDQFIVECSRIYFGLSSRNYNNPDTFSVSDWCPNCSGVRPAVRRICAWCYEPTQRQDAENDNDSSEPQRARADVAISVDPSQFITTSVVESNPALWQPNESGIRLDGGSIAVDAQTNPFEPPF